MSGQQVAVEIRKILKAQFGKKTKFSVRSDYDSVNIRWENGPTVSQVEDLICQFQMGHFDGMTDCYDYSNRRDDIPQCKYIFCNRNIEPELRKKVEEEIQAKWASELSSYQLSRMTYEHFERTSLI